MCIDKEKEREKEQEKQFFTMLAVPFPEGYFDKVILREQKLSKEEVAADWAIIEESAREFRENNLVVEGETE